MNETQKMAAFVPPAALERIEEIKAILGFQQRLEERLKKELSDAEQAVQLQMEIIDNLNQMYNINSTYTLGKSPILQSLSQTKSLSLKNKLISYNTRLGPLEKNEVLGNEGDITEIFIHNLSKATDFNTFLMDFPLIYFCIFPFENQTINISEITKAIEIMPVNRRMQFSTALFKQINDLSTIFESILSFATLPTISDLTETIEASLPRLLMCKRASFFIVKDGNRLVLEKGKIELYRVMSRGAIYESYRKKEISCITRESSNFTDDDQTILRESTCMLVVPCFNCIMILYDKIQGFKTVDFHISAIFQRFISEYIHSFTQTTPQNTSSQNHDIINNFNPEFLAKYFNCKYARIFHVSLKNRVFYDQVSNDKSSYDFTTGIVGQCIMKRRSIKIDRPEFSILFNPLVDRYSEDEVTSSLLVCPVKDKKKEVRWAVALYSRIGLMQFSEYDVSQIEMICSNMHQIIRTNQKSNELALSVETNKDIIDYFKSLNVLFDNIVLHSFHDTSRRIVNAISPIIPCSIEMYLLDKSRNKLFSDSGDFEESINSDSLLSKAIKLKKMKQQRTDNSIIVYLPVNGLDNSFNSLFKIEFEDRTKRMRKISSIYSTLSDFSSSASLVLKSTKSNAMMKIEKMMHNSAYEFEDVTDKKILYVTQPLKQILGSIVDASNEYMNLMADANYWIILSKLSPSIMYRAINDIITIGCTLDRYSLDNVIAYCIPKNDDMFITSTINLYKNIFKFCGEPDLPETKTPYIFHIFDEFTNTLDINVYTETPENLFSKLNRFIKDLKIESILSVDQHQLYELLFSIRSLNKGSFETKVDNALFAVFLINQLKINATRLDLLSIVFYILTQEIQISRENVVLQRLERGECCSPSSLLIYAAAKCKTYPFNNTDPDALDQLLEGMNFYSSSGEYEIYMIDDPKLYIVTLAKYSSFGRTEEVAKCYSKMFIGNDKLSLSLLEQEMRAVVIPILNHLNVNDSITKPFLDNTSTIIGVRL